MSENNLNLGEKMDSDKADEETSALGIIPSSDGMIRFASYIRKVFHDNATHREMSGIDQKLLNSMRASKGEYSPEQKAQYKAAGVPSDLYTPLTITKQRAALSQLSEIFTSPGDKPWTLSPSPLPEVPESVAKEEFQRIIATFLQIISVSGEVPTPDQMFRYAQSRMDEVYRKQQDWAKVRAERMEKKVHDQMIEGGWIDAFNTFSKYLVDYGTALIIGPIPRTMMRRRVKETKLGTYKYDLEPREVLCFEAVNPWDCYPSKGARNIKDGNICIRRRFSTNDLWRYASRKGKDAVDEGNWFKETVRALLNAYPEGGAKIDGQPYDLVRQILENDGPSDSNRCVMEGVEFFGDVRGSVLISSGICKKQDGSEIDPDEFYEVDAIEIAGYIVYCKVIDPCIGRPISKGVFYENAGSWWGDNIAERLDATQRTVNAALRNLINNMAMASGPMLYVKDMSRLTDKGPDSLKIKPWKVLKFNLGGYGQTDIPVGVLDFNSHMAELLKVFDWAKQQADDDSGIPAYTYGMNVTGGALRTSSGLTMMLSEANRVMKMIEIGIDVNVIRDCVRRTVDYNMVYDRDVSIKGDCEVNPAGVIGLILREAESARRKQMLQLALTPTMLQITGPKLPLEIAREEVKSLGIKNIDDAMPSKERIEEEEILQKLERLNQVQANAQEEVPPEEGGEVPAEADVPQPSPPPMAQPEGAISPAYNPRPPRLENMPRGGNVKERKSVA